MVSSCRVSGHDHEATPEHQQHHRQYPDAPADIMMHNHTQQVATCYKHFLAIVAAEGLAEGSSTSTVSLVSSICQYDSDAVASYLPRQSAAATILSCILQSLPQISTCHIWEHQSSPFVTDTQQW